MYLLPNNGECDRINAKILSGGFFQLGENYVHVHVHTLRMLVYENISDVTQSTCEYVSILIQRVQFSVASIILFTESLYTH